MQLPKCSQFANGEHNILTYTAIPLKSTNLWIVFQKIILIFGLYSRKLAEFKILKAYDIKETAIVTPDNYLDWLIKLKKE